MFVLIMSGTLFQALKKAGLLRISIAMEGIGYDDVTGAPAYYIYKKDIENKIR